MGADVIGGGNIEPRALEDEMRTAYLDYAMSVIVGRALPDVRDGLKPVHRRVLYAMHQGGLQPNRPYSKCARVVGSVMGDFHPHGDSAIYDTLVRMAQDFSLRYPLVDGQGNFGSIDDDPAAAMRYTEARLARMATEMLRDIDEDTVEFVPNYDGQTREPTVLPSRFPNLLVNGSSGIAVGMATNIPPHNLREVVGAVKAYIDDPDITVDGLMEHIKGPDFPTGGIIVGRQGIRDAYETGRGRVRVRARVGVEDIGRGKEALIVTELPFMVKKGGPNGLMVKIKDLVEEKKISEISDIQDYSDGRTGMRLVIELKRDAIPQVVLNKLYKHTPMQSTFGVNTVALVDGVPRTLPLQALIKNYVDHQRDVIVRRTKYRLQQAEDRAHILEGLLIAIGNIDEVIALIRASRDTDAARTGLMDRFELTRRQAQAIVDLRLGRLTALEADKIKSEYDDLVEQIAEFRAILGSEQRVLDIIKDELTEIVDAYGDERRTQITHSEDDVDIEDMIPDQQMVIAITHSGYIKSLPLITYRQQQRGGRGVTGMDMKDGDYIEHLFVTSSHDFLLFFSSRGKVYRSKVYDLPESSRTAKGRALVNVLPLREGERIQSVLSHTRLHRGQVPRLRDAQRHDQEDRVPRLQHPDQGRRHHRHQHPRRRRAGRRAADVGRRRHPDGLAQGPGGALPRGRRALDGPRHLRRAGHGRLRQGRRGPGHGRRPRRPGAAGRDRERLRQAHLDQRVPQDQPRRQGRGHDQADRGQGRAGRRPGGARARGARVHLRRRHGPAHGGARHQPLRPPVAGRAPDEHEVRRRRQRGRAGRRLRQWHRQRGRADRSAARRRRTRRRPTATPPTASWTTPPRTMRPGDDDEE